MRRYYHNNENLSRQTGKGETGKDGMLVVGPASKG
jgi:hypothetical protein